MRAVQTAILTGALCAIVATSFAAPPQPPPLDERQVKEVGRMRPDEAQPIVGLFFPPLPPRFLDSVKVIAGLSTGSLPEFLTWERIYTLALVRARTGARGVPKCSTRKSSPSLGRGTASPTSAGSSTTSLPAALMRARHSATQAATTSSSCAGSKSSTTARCDVALQENCLKLFQELIQGESSGLSALEVDLVEVSLVRARQRLADATAQFRDGLDELKAAMGLPPCARC